MADVNSINVRRDWVECPRDAGKDARWGVLYATLNLEGHIRISRATHEVLGAPDSYVLLYDVERNVIGMRPARLAVEKNAYRAIDRGNYGGKRINGFRLCREFGIEVAETVRFHHCQIDNSGVLILDLKDTHPVRNKRKTKKTAKTGDYYMDNYGVKANTY